MITNRMNKYLILLIVGLSSLFVARAETIWHYNASFNSFHDFTPAPQVKLGEQGLSVSNPSDTTMLVLSKRTASDEQEIAHEARHLLDLVAHIGNDLLEERRCDGRIVL